MKNITNRHYLLPSFIFLQIGHHRPIIRPPIVIYRIDFDLLFVFHDGAPILTLALSSKLLDFSWRKIFAYLNYIEPEGATLQCCLRFHEALLSLGTFVHFDALKLDWSAHRI